MTHATTPEPLVARAPRSALPWLVMAVWLGCTALAFWFFQVRPEHALPGQTTRLFDAEAHSLEAESWLRTLAAARPATAASPIATVVHVSRSGCDCNQYTEPHLEQIVGKYQRRGVSFMRATGSIPKWVASTPAALVFDRDGRLVYFGPYSDAARCGASGGLVERTLDAILKGNAPRPQRTYVRGCFCNGD